MRTTADLPVRRLAPRFAAGEAVVIVATGSPAVVIDVVGARRLVRVGNCSAWFAAADLAAA